jgi:hypothetical protein
VETDVTRDFSTPEDPSEKLALSDPEEEEEDHTRLTECLTLKSDTENAGYKSQFLNSSSVTKILETQSVQSNQFGIKSRKEKDASGLGDIPTGVPEDPAGVRSQKSSAVQQDLGQGSRPSNHTYIENADDSKTEDSTSLKSSNTSACSNSDSDTTEPQHTSTTGYTTDFSEESDELYDDSMAVIEAFASTEITESLDSPSHQFRLSEMDEDLLHPARYKAKLRALQAHVCRESAVAQRGLQIKTSNAEINLTPDSRFRECQKILTCIQRNITVLRDAGFCTSAATFLQIDPNRTQVAFLSSVELDKVAQLGRCIDETKSSLENLGVLDSGCKDLLIDYPISSTPPQTGDRAILFLRVLDLVLVSHVCSHISDFDHWMNGDTSTNQKFQISSQTSSILNHSAPLETGTMSFSRRTLKCLSGFLCGEQVWVLHGPNIDPKDSTELFLSTTPDAFADVWGPMWKITNARKPMEILRYDLEHGSVIPLSLIPGSRANSVAVKLNEELCHWIPHNELEELERTLASTSPPQITHSRLLIGACLQSVTPNAEECHCNLTDANDRFVSKGYRRIVGSSPAKWVTESKTVGTAVGGAGLGAPTIQYSHTMKNTGRPASEAILQRWNNNPPELRPWNCLLLRYGLQVSICTGNSRKVRLVDLLAGDTMREYMRTYPSYLTETWRVEFEEMLDIDPAQLVTFVAEQPSTRKSVEQYISACLDRLIHTGIGRGNDQFVALWVYHGQAWEIAFPRRYHGWTGFAEDSSFVVLEKCLVNVFGRGCCHPQEGISRMQKKTPAVLEVFLTISRWAELPDGLRRVRGSDGRPYWNVRHLRHQKHCIKLGKRGVLEGEGSCSKRVLIGKWSSEGLVAAGARKVSEIIGRAENHTEHINDDSEDELPPLPYLVQDV